jgi:hypothetical protein
MLRKFGGHIRQHVVAYLALFVALGGTAYAAGPLKPGDPAGGDLAGTYPNPTLKPCSTDQILKFSGSGWACSTDARGLTNVVARSKQWGIPGDVLHPDHAAVVTVVCEPGEIATGGGGHVNTTSSVDLRSSSPAAASGSPANGWQAIFRNTSANPVVPTITAWVLRAS